MFCQSLALGLLGSRVAYALKEPYTLVYTPMQYAIYCIFMAVKTQALEILPYNHINTMYKSDMVGI